MLCVIIIFNIMYDIQSIILKILFHMLSHSWSYALLHSFINWLMWAFGMWKSRWEFKIPIKDFLFDTNKTNISGNVGFYRTSHFPQQVFSITKSWKSEKIIFAKMVLFLHVTIISTANNHYHHLSTIFIHQPRSATVDTKQHRASFVINLFFNQYSSTLTIISNLHQWPTSDHHHQSSPQPPEIRSSPLQHLPTTIVNQAATINWWSSPSPTICRLRPLLVTIITNCYYQPPSVTIIVNHHQWLLSPVCSYLHSHLWFSLLQPLLRIYRWPPSPCRLLLPLSNWRSSSSPTIFNIATYHLCSLPPTTRTATHDHHRSLPPTTIVVACHPQLSLSLLSVTTTANN